MAKFITRKAGDGHTLLAKRTKRIDEEGRRAWYVATTNSVDRYGEIVHHTAMVPHLDTFRRHSPFLAQHQQAGGDAGPAQIGTVSTLAMRKNGVEIGVVYARTDLAEQYWQLAKDPAQSVAVSIGFYGRNSVQKVASEIVRDYPELSDSIRRAGLSPNDRVRVWTEIELLEVSQVSIPANPDAVQLSAGLRRSEESAGVRLTPSQESEIRAYRQMLAETPGLMESERRFFGDEFDRHYRATGGRDRFAGLTLEDEIRLTNEYMAARRAGTAPAMDEDDADDDETGECEITGLDYEDSDEESGDALIAGFIGELRGQARR